MCFYSSACMFDDIFLRINVIGDLAAAFPPMSFSPSSSRIHEVLPSEHL